MWHFKSVYYHLQKHYNYNYLYNNYFQLHILAFLKSWGPFILPPHGVFDAFLSSVSIEIYTWVSLHDLICLRLNSRTQETSASVCTVHLSFDVWRPSIVSKQTFQVEEKQNIIVELVPAKIRMWKMPASVTFFQLAGLYCCSGFRYLYYLKSE